MILAVAAIPTALEARQTAAQLSEIALADLNRRLAGPLPRVLFTALTADKASGLAQRMEQLGFIVLYFEAEDAPSDASRVIARRFEFTPGAFLATDAQGETHRVEASDVRLLQRGTRNSSTSEKVTTKEREFDLGRAVISGGLVMTKKTEKTEVKTTHTTDPFLLVQRADGGPEIMLYERRLDYRALGSEMQPASRGNFELVWTKLKALAPDRVDDRVSRSGFVTGLPATHADSVDLALHLVALARRRQPR